MASFVFTAIGGCGAMLCSPTGQDLFQDCAACADGLPGMGDLPDSCGRFESYVEWSSHRRMFA
jgi:hypothetical protein